MATTGDLVRRFAERGVDITLGLVKGKKVRGNCCMC